MENAKVFATVAAHSNFVSVGFTQGFSAVMLPQLDVTNEESSWIAGLGVISTPVGALLSGLLVDWLGRKPALLLPNFVFFISWLMIGFAPTIPVLYLGRALGGLAAGMVTTSYLYVCEIASTEHRGVLSAFGPVFVSIGVLLVYTIGVFFDWTTVAFIATFACIFSNLLIYLIPESPTWFVSQNDNERALKSLEWLRRDSKTAYKQVMQLSETLHQQQDAQNREGDNFMKTTVIKMRQLTTNCCQPDVYKPFLIIILFFFFQEGSGIYVFLFYSVQIFQQFGTDYDENVITITIGVLRLVMAILGAVLMVKFGRRQLSIFSGTCMSLALLVLSLYLVFVPLMAHPIHMVPVICLFFHVGFSMTGFLQIPFILSSEMFPARCRGVMGGITCSLAYVLIFVSVKIYPTLLELIKLEGILWAFCGMTTIGVVFLALFLPETKDRTFEEITDQFLGKKSSDQVPA